MKLTSDQIEIMEMTIVGVICQAASLEMGYRNHPASFVGKTGKDASKNLIISFRYSSFDPIYGWKVLQGSCHSIKGGHVRKGKGDISIRFREIVRQLCGGPQQISSENNVATQLHEREEIMTVTLLAVLAGLNVFLLGPPGTAKSLLARRISNAFEEAEFFEYLMQKFSTPEEIFGPIDIKQLKEGTYFRKTDGYLPQADFAFLDEIWKSNPPILNTLLTITNERKFRNGNGFEDVRLKGLIGASNEIPKKDEGLEALWDRFVVRLYVGRLTNHDHFMSMLQERRVVLDAKVTPEVAINIEEWTQWQNEIGKVKLSPETIQAVSLIKAELDTMEQEKQDLEFYVSDRRWQRAVMLLKASAFFSGRDSTNHLDTLLLRHCLWNSIDRTSSPDGKKCTRDIVEGMVTSHVGLALVPNIDFSDVDKLLDEAEALQESRESVGKLAEASSAINNMQGQVNTYHEQLEVYLQNALVNDDADRFRKVLQLTKMQISLLHERLLRLQSSPAIPPMPMPYKCPITDMEFIFVKGGTFEMGDLFGDGEIYERPVHKVTLDDFYIGKYPVTQREWKKLRFSSDDAQHDELPAVSHHETINRYIVALNSLIRGGGHYRLPTEAEWEYAARSGGKVEKYSGSDDPNEVAWFKENSDVNQYRPGAIVGKKKPNGLGIYDMSGNVNELCSDLCNYEYYTGSPERNPCCTDYWQTTSKAIRGGSTYSDKDEIRCSKRQGNFAITVGFRLAISANLIDGTSKA